VFEAVTVMAYIILTYLLTSSSSAS